MDIDLSKFEKKVYSQNGEDGITSTILNNIGVLNRTFVEIGAGNGTENNSRLFWSQYDFRGVMFDAKNETNEKTNLYNEFFTAENCLSIFKKHRVPISVDLFSIDIDLNDFYVVRNILKFYRPRLIICEYNSIFGPNEDKVILYSPYEFWTGDNYQQASLLSWFKLYSLFGYSLVYCEREGVNCFWIYNIEIPEWIRFININNLDKLYVKRKWDTPDKKNRPYISFEEAMKV